MTVQIQKQNKTVDEVFLWTIQEIKKSMDLFNKHKSEIILETAQKLDKETDIEKQKISTEIVKRLDGFVDQSYVNKILKDYPQYKDQKQQANAKSGRNIPAKSSQTNDSDDGAKPIEMPADKVKVEQPKNSTIKEHPGPKEVQDIHNIDPLDYKIDELEQYDKPLLIEIVKAADENNAKAIGRIKYWGSVNEDLRKEIERLKSSPPNISEDKEFEILRKRFPNSTKIIMRMQELQKENERLKKEIEQLKEKKQ